MSLVEEYYELNEAEEVSPIWKILHIGFYWCAGAFGLWCGFTLASVRLTFDDRCYLFTEVKASKKEELAALRIDPSNINWESDPWCDYYQFSMVSSFIVGFIWGTIYLMCGKGGKSLTGLPQPWRIVWPSLIFNFAYFVIILCTAIFIHRGTDYFCGRHDFKKRLHTKTLAGKCEPLKWLLLKKDVHYVSLQLDIVVKTSWGCALCWFVLFLLPLFRIVFVVDFNMCKICVFKIDDTVQNKREEVLRITNYEEPKKLYHEKDGGAKMSDGEGLFGDLEAGKGKTREARRAKPEKKSMRQNYNVSNRSLHVPNAVFYETADLRMLSREKKRKKSLDEAFGRNRTNLALGLRKSNKNPADSAASGKSEVPTFLYRCSEELNAVEDDAYDLSLPSTPQKPEDEWPESGSDVDSNILIRFKKRI